MLNGIPYAVAGLVAVVSILALAYHLFYKKVGVDQALVVVSRRGKSVYLRNKWVSPFSDLFLVPLHVMKVTTVCEGDQGILTKGGIRLDVEADFFLAIPGVEEQIMNASDLLGSGIDSHELTHLYGSHFVSVLRVVAGRTSLDDIKNAMASFRDVVRAESGRHLLDCGISVEAVAIVRIEPTHIDELDENNAFDAEAIYQQRKQIEENQSAIKKMEYDEQVAREEQQLLSQLTVKSRELDAAKQEAELELEKAREQEENKREIEINRIENEKLIAQAKQEQALAELEYKIALAGKEVELAVEKARGDQAIKMMVLEYEATADGADIAKVKATALAKNVAEEKVLKHEQIMALIDKLPEIAEKMPELMPLVQEFMDAREDEAQVSPNNVIYPQKGE